MAEAAPKPSLVPQRRIMLGLIGLGALAFGVLMLVYGLTPMKQMWDAVGPTFSGGPPPEDLSERMDAAMAAIKGRLLFTGIGFVLLLAGFVMAKAGFSKPKRSVEDLVNEEVDRRMGAMPARVAIPAEPGSAMPPPLPPRAPASTVAPAATSPASPASMATPVTMPPPTEPMTSNPAPVVTHAVPHAAPVHATSMSMGGRRTHCPACGSVLVAGGRLCPRGHAQA